MKTKFVYFLKFWIFVQLLCIFLMPMLKLYTLHSHYWDLGVFDHFLYIFSKEGNFYWFLKNHFRPILFFYGLGYNILPSPYLLLFLQSCAVAASGYLVYLLAMRQIGSKLWALFWVWCFFMHPMVLYQAFWDFHTIYRSLQRYLHLRRFCTFFISWAYAPTPNGRYFYWKSINDYGYDKYLPTSRTRAIKRAIREKIPARYEMSVAFLNRFYDPYLGHKRDVYILPKGVKEADYVVIDMQRVEKKERAFYQRLIRRLEKRRQLLTNWKDFYIFK